MIPVLRSREVIAATLDQADVRFDAFIGDCRRFEVVRARKLCALILRKDSGRGPSYPEIARVMGRPSHSSVIAMVKSAEKIIKEGGDEAVRFDNLRCRIIADASQRAEQRQGTKT